MSFRSMKTSGKGAKPLPKTACQPVTAGILPAAACKRG
jgi:hypothetical protein